VTGVGALRGVAKLAQLRFLPGHGGAKSRLE
jgi:hypothetical protein